MVIILPIIVCTLSAGKEAKNHFLTFLFWTVISYFQKEYLSSPLPSLGRFLTHMFHDLYSINSSTIIAEKCTGDACFTYRQHFEAGKGFMNCPESGALFNYLIWTVTGSSNQILSRGVNTEPQILNSVCDDRGHGSSREPYGWGTREEVSAFWLCIPVARSILSRYLIICVFIYIYYHN